MPKSQPATADSAPWNSPDPATRGAQLLSRANALNLTAAYADDQRAAARERDQALDIEREAYEQLGAVDIDAANAAIKIERDKIAGDTQLAGGLKLNAMRHGEARAKFIANEIAARREAMTNSVAGDGADATHAEFLAALWASQAARPAGGYRAYCATLAPLLAVGTDIALRGGGNVKVAMNSVHLDKAAAQNDEAVLAGIVHAKNAWGGKLRLTGSPDFKAKVWVMAQLQGVEVEGYKPTPAAKASLDAMRAVTAQAEPAAMMAPTGEQAPDAEPVLPAVERRTVRPDAPIRDYAALKRATAPMEAKAKATAAEREAWKDARKRDPKPLKRITHQKAGTEP